MKNIFVILAIIVFTLAANLVSASNSLFGNTLTNYGTYQLTPSSKSVVIDNVTYKTWNLKYSGSSEKYQLIVVPGKDGNNSYKVIGKDFEIKYNVNSNSFGGSYIEPELLSASQIATGKTFNQKELKSQTVNTPTMDSEEYLSLIACFMPRLMN
jgi:hypothetical protein